MNAQSLEQTGTEADCDIHGGAHYTAWYELVPDVTVTVKLAVAPGDTIKASVSVAHKRVTIMLRDLTSGKHSKTVIHAAHLDTSSAEWIAEAPSVCHSNSSNCRSLPLSDFGSITFTNAGARLRNHRHGAIASPFWSVTPIALRELATRSSGGRVLGPRELVTATPTPLGPAGNSFTVTWAQRQQTGSRGPRRVYPGG
jgi:hypothetical protein